MNINKIIQEEAKNLLFEDRNDDILRTMFSLIKYNGGQYKSDKQRDYLRKNGDELYATQTYHFGAHNGAMAQVGYEIYLDDIGIVKVIKLTKNKTKQDVYWVRTADSMRKSEETKINKEFSDELQRQSTARGKEHEQILNSIVQKVKQAGNKYYNDVSLDKTIHDYTIHDTQGFQVKIDMAKFNDEYNQMKQFATDKPQLNHFMVLYDELNKYFKKYPQGFQNRNTTIYDDDYNIRPEFQSLEAKKAYLDSLKSEHPDINEIINEEAKKLFSQSFYDEQREYDEGVGDKYAEKKFNIPDTQQKDYLKQTDKVVQSPEMGKFVGNANNHGEELPNEPIFLNPKSLNNFESDVRAVSDTKGNLYVAQHNGDFIHGVFYKAMGMQSPDEIYQVSGGLSWHRIYNSNIFGFSDTSSNYLFWNSNSSANVGKVEQYYKNLEQVQKRNPQFKFVPRYYDEIKTM